MCYFLRNIYFLTWYFIITLSKKTSFFGDDFGKESLGK